MPSKKELQILMTLKEDVTKRMKGVEGSIRRFVQTVQKYWKQIAAGAVAAAAAVAVAWSGFNVAAEYQQQQQAFENLAESYGRNGQDIVDSLKAVSDGTLTTKEIMQESSKAMTLGLDPDSFGKLMQISRASAKAMGEDVKTMFQSIVTGIGRQSKMILDNLGIVVKAEQAYEDYAREIGKTKNQLTDVEKRQAFMNATLKAGEEIIGRVNMSQRTQKENMQIIGASLKEARDQLLLFITSSVDLTEVADKFKRVADSVKEIRYEHVTNQIDNLKDKIIGLHQTSNPLTKLRNWIWDTSGTKKDTVFKEYSKQLSELILKSKELKLEFDQGAINLLSQSDKDNVISGLNEIENASLDTANSLRQAMMVEKERMQLIDQLNSEITVLRSQDTEYLKQELAEQVEAWKAAYGEDQEVMAVIEQYYSLKSDKIKGKSEKTFAYMDEMNRRTAANMQSSMSDLFFDGITTGFDNLEDAATQFGNTMLKTITDLLAQKVVKDFLNMGNSSGGGSGGGWLGGALNLVGSWFGGGGGATYHDGGMIKKYHSGGMINPLVCHSGRYLAPDEVPIIAQTGEAVLNRSATKAIGGKPAVDALNGGKTLGGGEVSTNIVNKFYISAMDGASVQRIFPQIEQLLVRSYESNGPIRQASAQYG